MNQKTQKYVDWVWIIVVNFMWATQVAAIKLIGDRLGAVAIAFIPMILSVILFFPPPQQNLWADSGSGSRPKL